MAETSAMMSSSSSSSPAAQTPLHRRQYREMMHHRAMHQVNECLAVCLHSPRSEDKWTAIKREKHLELYAKRSNTTKSVFYLGMNELHCGFDEIYELLNYQTTTQFRLVMKLLYGTNFKDGALMATHAPRQYDDDYDVADVQHAALWFTLQARRESLLGKDNMLAFFQALMVLHPDRSFTTTGRASSSFAGTTTTTNAQGGPALATFARPSEHIQKRTLALAWLPFYHRSEDADMVPPVQETMRLQYTLIVEEVARHKLRVCCVATSFRDGDDINQSRSSSAARTIAQRLVNRSISRLEAAVVAARISAQTLRLPHQWVPNKDRVSCVICWKSFHAIIRRRHHCRLCGEVVCGSCSAVRNKTAFELGGHHDLEKVRVCHMCSNRRNSVNGSGESGAPGRVYGRDATRGGRRVVDAFSPAYVGGSTIDSILGVTRTRIPILEHSSGDGGEDDDDEEEENDRDEYNGRDDLDFFTRERSSDEIGSGSSGGGYVGYVAGTGIMLSSGLMTSCGSTQKLISLRSMTRAELMARSTSANAVASLTRKQSDGSTTSSSSLQPRKRPLPSSARPPLAYVGRLTANTQAAPVAPAAPVASPQQQPPPPAIGAAQQPALQYYGARPTAMGVALPAPLPLRFHGQADSISFLHPSVSSPELELEDLQDGPPRSIVAAVGSHERISSTTVNVESYERPSLWSHDPFFDGNSSGLFDSKQPQDTAEQSRSSDTSRRSSAMTLAALSDNANASRGSDSKVSTTAATTMATTTTAAATTSVFRRRDHMRERKRLELMRVICSPACTLVDRGLMRECCTVAASAFGVRGAFIARLDEHYVQLEHIVGTTKLSAMDHFLRRDTPCEFVLDTPHGESVFWIDDCSADKRTRHMMMTTDVGMRLFVGVNIVVRSLPIACLCVFSEHDDDAYGEKGYAHLLNDEGGASSTLRLSTISSTSASQYEFHVLEKAAQRISMELEGLVHGIVLD